MRVRTCRGINIFKWKGGFLNHLENFGFFILKLSLFHSKNR